LYSRGQFIFFVQCGHYMSTCHHGTVHPLVVDGGDGLQIWRVAWNISNKQPQGDSKQEVVLQLGCW